MFSPENEFETFDNFELSFVIINAKEIIHVKVPILFFFLGGREGGRVGGLHMCHPPYHPL